MRRSSWTTALTVALTVVLALPALAQKAGEHKGEKKQLDVEIAFSLESGQTMATPEGTFFCFHGKVIFEDKVYPPIYHGAYPLYFFGEPVGVTIRVGNLGPRAKTKLRVTLESYVLNTDGSSGAALMPAKQVEVELARGETIELDGTFVAEPTPDSENGLNRFVVKLAHPNEGRGPGNPEPALIMVKEGIFCPPSVEQQLAAE